MGNDPILEMILLEEKEIEIRTQVTCLLEQIERLNAKAAILYEIRVLIRKFVETHPDWFTRD